MLLNDKQITDLAVNYNMISPFFPTSISKHSDGKRMPSCGQSSYGYDIRVGNNFKLFKKPKKGECAPIIDLCDFSATEDEVIEEFNDVDEFILPPHGFVLTHSMERMIIPRDVTVVCMGKSSVARSGIFVVITPLEAAWQGFITIEIFNMLEYPVRIKAGVGICQLMFYRGEPCETSYADRAGKYQNQPARAVTAI